MIIDALIDKIRQMENPSVVGLDPRLSYIPDEIKDEAFSKHGKTPKGAVEAFLSFNKKIIDEIHGIVPAVKPQVAMYEQFGADGMDCYIKTCEYAKDKGMIVIGDVKRGDISTTAETYSDGHLGRVDVGGEEFGIFKEDFITVNPYLGYDGIEPFLRNCKKHDKGIFVLVKTSNPSSGDLQDVITENGETVYERAGRLVSEWGKGDVGGYGFSSVGAVVGATYPKQADGLRKLMPHTFFLVPGYGTQGGTAEDIRCCFVKDRIGAIVNSSRGIIAAHQNPKYAGLGFPGAVRRATEDMRDDLRRMI